MQERLRTFQKTILCVYNGKSRKRSFDIEQAQVLALLLTV